MEEAIEKVKMLLERQMNKLNDSDGIELLELLKVEISYKLLDLKENQKLQDSFYEFEN